MKNWLLVIFNPGYWLQNHSYSPTWDKELRRLLNSGDCFSNIDQHEATLGGRRVWITNHPYASFTFSGVRPKRTTILAAHNKLLSDTGCRSDFELQEKLIGDLLK